MCYNSGTVKRKPRLHTRNKRGETQKNASVSGTYSIAFLGSVCQRFASIFTSKNKGVVKNAVH